MTDNELHGTASRLHPKEKLVLQVLSEDFRDIDEIAKRANISRDTALWALNLLEEKNLAEIYKEEFSDYKLGLEGEDYLRKNFPEIRLLHKLKEVGGKAQFDKLKLELEKDEQYYGIPWSLRRGWVKLTRKNSSKVIELTELGEEALKSPYPPLVVLQKLSRGDPLSPEEKEIVLELKKRGETLKEVRRKKFKARISEKGKRLLKLIRPVGEVNELTRELIVTGKWREVRFRPYDVELPTVTPIAGRKHPYKEIIDEIREVLIGLGFEEVVSPPIEVNFWNCDALFMPSDHPARGIHDIFYLKLSANREETASQDIWERVKRTHENGWVTGSTGWGVWDPKLALRLVLRSQTTAVSARSLSVLKPEDLPKKIFTIDRNYRPDKIDSTHLPEFNQCEGIVVAPDMNLRHLMGFIEAIAKAFGIEEVKFQPAFFPFTEPSVVGYIKHPRLGWIEALPGGIFRPEVTKPLGIDVPVLAWGLGIDRLAMVTLDIDDIRMLFTQNLKWLREKKTPSIWGFL